uniref:DED domain-containing protein n=1 Tax=Steinernema glaseri TaxID=37863 RepID=A0A1I7YM50_9BILA
MEGILQGRSICARVRKLRITRLTAGLIPTHEPVVIHENRGRTSPHIPEHTNLRVYCRTSSSSSATSVYLVGSVCLANARRSSFSELDTLRVKMFLPSQNVTTDTMRAMDGTIDRTTSNRLFDYPPGPNENMVNSYYNDSLLGETRALPPIMDRTSRSAVVNNSAIHRIRSQNISRKNTINEENPATYSAFDDTIAPPPRTPTLLEDIKIDSNDKTSSVPFRPQPLTIVDQYRELNISSLADVLKWKKFWMTSETRTILPILSECSKDIGTAMDQWSLLLYLSDENVERMKMVLQNDLLEELLGFTVKHCKDLSRSGKHKELARCMDRAREVLNIFKRLDLVYTVEFSPSPNSTPLVKKVHNLARKLAFC